jgi:ring-1,2-phenylacetyl-CoA epoxidase subunit PaaD
MLTKEQVLTALQDVKDPEIPMVSIVELGIVAEILIEGKNVRVKITPTFAGCPAVDVMRTEAEKRLRALGVDEARVEITFDPPWNSDRISADGRRKLKEFGLAPPRPHFGHVDLIQLELISCPFCGSADTTLESAFGSTLCRAMHYCRNCQQSFEQFKPL